MTKLDDQLAALEARSQAIAEAQVRADGLYKSAVQLRDQAERRERAVALREDACGKVEELEGRMRAMQAEHERVVNDLKRQIQAAEQKAGRKLEAARAALS